MHKHILICGDIGVGKSTLVSKLLKSIDKPIYGYKTLSMNKTKDGYHEIFLFPPDDISTAKLVAKCSHLNCEIYSEVFDTYGIELLSSCKSDGIIVMDEIGFMESKTKLFAAKILELLDGSIPIIGAVKTKNDNCEFLNRVRGHKNVELFTITKENRNELLEKINIYRGSI